MSAFEGGIANNTPRSYALPVLSWFDSVNECFQRASHECHLPIIYLLLLSFVALERTFLGYLRTSLALSMVAVIIAQLFRLQHVETPNRVFGFFALGIPLACVCTGAAIVVLLLGAYRFWRQQNAMLRGKIHAGGWEMNAIGMTVFMVCLAVEAKAPTRLMSTRSYSHFSFCW